MAKTATYEGPWDSRSFTKKDLGADKAYEFQKGVPVEVEDGLEEKLTAAGKFTFGEASADDGQGKLDLEGESLTDETGGDATDQTGDAVSTPSSGRASSRRSSR